MKRIINGKTYDTDTATLVAEWDNGKFANDMFYEYGNLYITDNKQWFLTGDEIFMNVQTGGEVYPEFQKDRSGKMMLLNENDVLSWCSLRAIDPDELKDHLTIEQG